MSEILDLANSIATTKENIRAAIVNRGVACGPEVPFASYAGKISRIARDPAIWARNDLAKNPAAGEKVLLQKLQQTAAPVVKFYSKTQINNRGGLRLLPYTATRFAMVNCDSDNRTVSGWTKEDGFRQIYQPASYFSSFAPVNYNYVYLTPYLYWIRSWSSNNSSLQSMLLQPDGNFTAADRNYYLGNGCVIDLTDVSAGQIKSFDPVTGAAGDVIAAFEGGVDDAYNANSWCGFNGKEYFLNRWNTNYRIYKNNGGVAQAVYSGTLDIFGEGTGYFLGVTPDNRYLIYNVRKGDACYPKLLKVGEDWSLSEDIGLALAGIPSYYPWLQVLFTNDQGTIRMFKYQGGKWVEKTVDFPDTFTQSSQVTVNYDCSQIFVNDCAEFDAGNAYLYNLTVTDSGYKAMAATPFNYNSACITGFATGEINPAAGTVEVNALLPVTAELPPITPDQ